MDKKTGFIAGTFDILHPGYISALQDAKDNCDYLIVGLHEDPSVERTGKFKPIFSLRKIIERIVIKKGLTKNRVTAVARDNLVKEKKYKVKAVKNIIPLTTVKIG